jgi:nondiscriminating glutamyl-tRNA synthetase
MESKPVITRFAPSPTGYFHAGSYRTALFAWIFARQNNGKFILRIEDTDKTRSKKEYEDNIIESLKWLGLTYDAFYRQSDRTEIYKKYIQQLIASGHAYISNEELPVDNNVGHIDSDTNRSKSDNSTSTNRKEVIRFKNPNKKVRFDDIVRGTIESDTTELGDFIIAKSLDEPVFHLAVVVDDHDAGVTHVIRGEDHISNTTRHILLYEALGAALPKYAHIPLLLAPDRSKLSKRNGAVAVSEYRDRGYLASAVFNYLTLLGWHPSDDREVLGTEDIIKEFTLERIQKGGAIFDEEKLAWFNRQYILQLSDTEFTEHVAPFIPEWLSTRNQSFKNLLPLLREKVGKFSDVTDFFSKDGELSFIKEAIPYPKELLLWKKKPDMNTSILHLKQSLEILSTVPESSFTSEAIKALLWPYAEANGKGDVLWPLRVALTGKERSPDPFISAAILGKEESLRRIEFAIKS